MRHALLLLPGLGLVALLLAGPSHADLSTYSVVDEDAPAVTAADIAERDHFWPYRVELTEPLVTERGTLHPGLAGVLITVRPTGFARIDFGRDGRREVPIASTDVIERANRVRVGTEPKFGPNFVHEVGNRLGDAAADSPATVEVRGLDERSAFLAVFGSLSQLEEMAPVLAPLEGRAELMTVVFPQGGVSDAEVWRRLREADWRVAFVLSLYSEAYTRARLGPGTSMPAVMLVTPDGRVLLEEGFAPETIVSRIDAALGAHVEGRVAKGAADAAD